MKGNPLVPVRVAAGQSFVALLIHTDKGDCT